MFTQATPSAEDPQVRTIQDTLGRGPARTGGPSPSEFRHIYVGRRETGHPVVDVLRQNGAERLRPPTRGGFDWGWPGIGGARRLAHALLLDLTGRNPPPWIRDTLATDKLAHLPWAAFSLTGRELLGWIEARGYTISDWPPANPTLACELARASLTSRGSPRTRRRHVPAAPRQPRSRYSHGA
jgi:hypothetical protein